MRDEIEKHDVDLEIDDDALYLHLEQEGVVPEKLSVEEIERWENSEVDEEELEAVAKQALDQAIEEYVMRTIGERLDDVTFSSSPNSHTTLAETVHWRDTAEDIAAEVKHRWHQNARENDGVYAAGDVRFRLVE